MTPFRWTLAALSFAAAIGVSIYIVESSWPVSATSVSLSWGTQALLMTIALLELGARALKVRLSAAALRIPMSYRLALRASAGGDFGAAITPARTGAEPARFLICAESGMSSTHILLVIFAELFLEVLSLAVITIVMFVVFRGSGPMILGMVGLVAAYAALVLGIGAFGVVLSRRRTSGPPPRWAERLGLRAERWQSVQRALRQLRSGIDGMRDARVGVAFAALGASVAHVALRLAILPVIVHSVGAPTALAPLILWPIVLTYGGVVAPVPAGGGAIEVAFRALLGGAIPARILGASLVWWRFYTFYLYVILGALVAGDTVLRALRTDRNAVDALFVTGSSPVPAAAPAVSAASPPGSPR